jgi:hypothetical protein
MVAAVAHCRAASTRAAGFLKATCLAQLYQLATKSE